MIRHEIGFFTLLLSVSHRGIFDDFQSDPELGPDITKRLSRLSNFAASFNWKFETLNYLKFRKLNFESESEFKVRTHKLSESEARS